jgi:hypothetical protein
MPKTVQFRFEGQQIIVGQAGVESTIAEKYCDFLCVLICAEPDEILTRDALVRLDSWAGNQPLSAGKQVARFLAGLARNGIFPVEQIQKTNGWRLAGAWRAAVTPALRTAAKARVAGRVAAIHHGTGAGLATLLEWYRSNFEALSAMTTGRAAHGYAVLRGNMKATADEQLFAISNLLATRIEQRLDQPRLPVLASINLSVDVIARALEIRRLAAYALHSNAKDWPQLERTFRHLLAVLAPTADLTSMAIVRNALAVLLRRQGDMDGALENIGMAAPLAVLSGDLILIQNVAFNLANIASEIERIRPGFVDQTAFTALLAFDAEVRDTMALGRDSAQTELLLAFLLVEQKRDDEAQTFLNMAAGIIAETNVPSDCALFARVSGLLAARQALANGDSVSPAINQLREAIRLFTAAGYHSAAKEVTREVEALETHG